MLPFTADQFFAVFATYNTGIWPMQIIAYLIGVIAAALALFATSGRVILGLLAVLWIWTGIAYHALAFAAINPAAYAFAALFVAEGVLLTWVGVVRASVRFDQSRPTMRVAAALVLIGYAAILYPLIGGWTGHHYPAAPTFGVTPCPLTIFTFGILLLARGRPAWTVMVIPLIWAAIGGSAAVLLRVAPDWMLPVAAVVSVVLLLRRQDAVARQKARSASPP